MNEQLLRDYEREALHQYAQERTTGSGHAIPYPATENGAQAATGNLLSRVDWRKVFIVAVIAVNVAAVIYGLSKIGAAFSIGGAVYAVVTGGTTVFYMLFFAVFAVVMIRKYEGYAMLATVMTLLCAFVI